MAHRQLDDQGFLVRFTDLVLEHQQLIEKADFRHYMIWTGQGKADSPSTPCRIIVYPTMSGLNLCLPKGENLLAKINEIIIKSQASKYTWATDISKMYNQLALSLSSYRYPLLQIPGSICGSRDLGHGDSMVWDDPNWESGWGSHSHVGGREQSPTPMALPPSAAARYLYQQGPHNPQEHKNHLQSLHDTPGRVL